MRKGTILIPSGPANDPDRVHLFVVLNDPVGPEGCVLLASFSTVTDRYYCEETCIVEPAECEHPFLTRRSFVRYQRLRIEPIDRVSAGLSTGAFERMVDLPDDVFERVHQGVFDSPFSAPKFKRFLAAADAAA